MNKNLIVALGILFLTACSSGTTVSEEPANLTGVFAGTFKNTPDTQSGTVTLNIAQATGSTEVSGNIIFDSERENCLINASVTGTASGYTLSLTADQASSSGSSGATTEGTLSIQLTQTNNGRQLDGTYVSSGDTCSNSTGSGTISLSR